MYQFVENNLEFSTPYSGHEMSNFRTKKTDFTSYPLEFFSARGSIRNISDERKRNNIYSFSR
jgi:hypothetical protein